MIYLPSLTVVTIINDAVVTPEICQRFSEILNQTVVDFDFVLVANGVSAKEALALKALAAAIPDMTVVFLGEHVHDDLARLVGIEHAVGDYVLFCDMIMDDPDLIPALLAKLHEGYDLVVGDPGVSALPIRPVGLRVVFAAYSRIYTAITAMELDLQPTGLRVMSRAAALFLAGRPNAEFLMRAKSIGPSFPATSVHLSSGTMLARRASERGHSWSKGVGILLSVSTLPLRSASYAALLGGVLSVVYSLYVFAVYLLKPDVAPGWTTISLQLAAMMFIFSVVLLFIGEYVMQIHSASPPRSRRYLVLRELRSPLSRRNGRLNVVDADGKFQLGKPDWIAESKPGSS